MAGIVSVLRKTLKRSTNVVRRVGKATRSTLRRGTNTIGLTKKRRTAHRKSHRKSHRGRKH
jgi:hypothetical protein